MSQKDIVVKGLVVKSQTIFSLDELYKMLYRWFEEHRYDFQEREYKEEDKGNNKKDLYLQWHAERKIDDYMKFVIEINFFIRGVQGIEVERGGVKVDTNKGEVEMKTTAYIFKDYDNKWEKSPVMRFLREIYDKKIIHGRIEGYETELHEEVNIILDEVKAFLNLHRF